MAETSTRGTVGGVLILVGGILCVFVLGASISTFVAGWPDLGYLAWIIFIALPLIHFGGKMRKSTGNGIVEQ
ncbi:hypothetical protein NBM05_08545 [Rothia sp. AR01]|uniref:Uncharacterized protein n=1 Tax=Rothia santali TaxID=2949643 RepID=A0A9X2HDD6_9MICC|nr:hypothetical protein [Rothia santali]MCP3426050.1 hypothetical protein [Rothia santali]